MHESSFLSRQKLLIFQVGVKNWQKWAQQCFPIELNVWTITKFGFQDEH